MLTLAMIALFASAGAHSNPLAPAAEGHAVCYLPNDDEKTCWMIESYRPLGGANYMSSGEILISADDWLSIEGSSPVVLKGKAICGPIRASDLAKSRIKVKGAVITGAKAAPYRAQVNAMYAPLFGRTTCTTYEQTADGLFATSMIDGKPVPEGDVRVRWIRPDEGFKVAP